MFRDPWMKKFMSDEGLVPLNSLSEDYPIAYGSLQASNKSQALTLKITLKRNIAKGILQMIAPPGLLVAVSWESL